MKDYRSIPVDVLRDFARTQTEVTSIRQVADDVGVGRSTLHKFILGRTAPQPRVRRLLGLWYLERIDAALDVDVARPYAGALDTLLAGLPEALRIEHGGQAGGGPGGRIRGSGGAPSALA